VTALNAAPPKMVLLLSRPLRPNGCVTIICLASRKSCRHDFPPWYGTPGSLWKRRSPIEIPDSAAVNFPPSRGDGAIILGIEWERDRSDICARTMLSED